VDKAGTGNVESLEGSASMYFLGLIRPGDVYVDKTGIIQKLLASKYRTVFLNRPRRFGKTLLVSTIEQILKGDKAKFKTLKIGQPDSGYDWESSHVIRLDMSIFGKRSANDFEMNLSNKIRRIANSFGIILTDVGSGPLLGELIETLYNNHKTIPLVRDGKNITADIPEVSVLIDEYDNPLVRNFNKPKVMNGIKEIMSGFYDSLKASAEMTRFVFITGITRFEEFASFSSMNLFGDITFDPDYSAICGFTQKEIMDIFQNDISKALILLNTDESLGPPKSTEDILGLILDWYDGYSWDGKARVLNPVSVLSYFQKFAFGRYWYNTGATNFLQELQIHDDHFFTSLSTNTSATVAISHADTMKISPESTLLATGYLTVGFAEGGVEEGVVDKTYHLNIPNLEVRMSYAQDYLIRNLYPNITLSNQARIMNLAKNFCSELCGIDADDAANSLSSIFAGIPYDFHAEIESFYKALMNVVLIFARGFLTADKYSGGWRPDFVLEMRNQVLVIEVEFSKSCDSYVNGTIDNPMGIPQTEAEAGDGRARVIEKSRQVQERKQNWDGRENILTLLDNGIDDAFEKIFRNAYTLEYMDGMKKVWAVAVSLVGRTGVKIKFREVKCAKCNR
jgi:hypothetical protein